MRVASSRIAALAILVFLPAIVGACGSKHRQADGALLGAANGVAPSSGHRSRPSATAGSGTKTVVGGIVVTEIGRQMDAGERRLAADAEYRALEYGQSGSKTPWENRATRHRGAIVPGRPWQQGERYCRTYTHTVYRNNSADQIEGTACRDPNGTWRSVG